MSAVAISITLGTYNGARFLPEQLESLSCQQRLPDELVVGDDCSTDATATLIEAYARQAPFPVRLHVNPQNLGFGGNFAATLLRCRGRHIYFCDQDDRWLPEKIAVCEDIFAASTMPIVVTHDAVIADENLIPGNLTLGEQMHAGGGNRDYDIVHGCCLAFDAFFQRFFRAGFRHSHDTWLVAVAHLLDARVHLDRPLLHYRRHGGNASGGHFNSARRTSKAKRWISRLNDIRKSNIRLELDNSLLVSSDMLQSFEDNRDHVVRHFGKAKLENAIETLSSRVIALKRRQEVLAIPRWQRPAGILGLYRAGGYRLGSALGILRDVFA
jgi:glycosyltransferase involved in cell wall biosynthesis